MRFVRIAFVAGVAIAAGVLVVSGCECRLGEKGPPTSATLPASVEAITLYDNDPNHLWNRLHSVLFIRTGPDGQQYGQDRLDPLLWRNTTHLVEGPSHTLALAVLDEFLNKHGERLIQDPLKRAILQRDLWAVFDWAASSDNRLIYGKPPYELQRRLAAVIGRLALPSEQIAKLPDNYAAAVNSKAYATAYDAAYPERPFLPPDLFAPTGPWVCLGISGDGVAAPVHVQSFNGRSAFLIFLRLPEGRQATINYLADLQYFPNPYSLFDSDPLHAQQLVDPKVPQFSVGTEVAMVRQALLVNDQGNTIPTALTESVQIRVFNGIPSISSLIDKSQSEHELELRRAMLGKGQSVYEFKLNCAKLFAGVAGGLRALEPDEKDFIFVQFRSSGVDPFEISKRHPVMDDFAYYRHRVEMQTCMNCHSGPGIYSINSFIQDVGYDHRYLPALEDFDINRELSKATSWKGKQYDWGLLQGMMAK